MNAKQAALAAVATKTQWFLHDFFTQISSELANEEGKWARLAEGGEAVESSAQALSHHKFDLEQALKVVVDTSTKLAEWLAERRRAEKAEAVDTSNRSSAVNGCDGGRSRGDNVVKTGSLVLSEDPRSAKMLELLIESQAIEDTLYGLDRALVRHSNDCPVENAQTLDAFMRSVRQLARVQFKAQAHANKILGTQQVCRLPRCGPGNAPPSQSI